MSRKVGGILVMSIMLALVFSGCQTTDDPIGMPNPASVYCEEQGGALDIREDENGQVGFCIFPDGSECEEWAFFRGECQPGDSPQASAAGIEPVDAAPDGWKTYRNEALGYTFLYPADAVIESGSDPLRSLIIQGPLVDDERWPIISVSHPPDREEYQLPADADLAQWLVDHNLLMIDDQQPPVAEIRQPDVTIAGMSAIHTRFERSPQSYAYDKYFLAHSGQVYVIVITHTGDREDWAVYDKFLQSFRFEE